MVKNCYKQKIDSRDFANRFCGVSQCPKPWLLSFMPPLQCNRTTFGVQRDNFCRANGALMEVKSSPFAIKTIVLWFLKNAQKRCFNRNALIINLISLYAQNSRISSQRFLSVLSSQFWAVRNANIVLRKSLRLRCCRGVWKYLC